MTQVKKATKDLLILMVLV